MLRRLPLILTGLTLSLFPTAGIANTSSARIEKVALTPGLMDSAGTISFWFTPESLLRDQVHKYHVLRSDALDFWIDVRGGSVLFLLHINEAMAGKQPDGSDPKLFWMASEFKHFNKGQRYHAAWTWDCENGERNGFYLNGVRHTKGSVYSYPGQIRPAEKPITMEVISDGLRIDGFKVHDHALSEKELRRRFLETGEKDYTNEGIHFSGKRFVPKDVKWDTPVYESSFEDPSEERHWSLEGGDHMNIKDGHLELWTTSPKAFDKRGKRIEFDEESEEPKASHLVCWLKKEIPADFLLEFTIRPRDPMEGLGIVFFAARGVNGESIFDDGLQERTGRFSQYINGDINNYHVSYWAGGRGSANMRKNAGFRLVSIGKDLVADFGPPEFKTVRVYKRGGQIRVIVNDVVSVEFDDPEDAYGKPWTHSGWIGLRHMAHAGYAEYGHIKVWPLKDGKAVKKEGS